jgi:hypothetical protein
MWRKETPADYVAVALLAKFYNGKKKAVEKIPPFLHALIKLL